jgi:exopolysaccharide production protein ExoY
MDVALAALSLVLLAPALVLVAALLWFGMGRPVLVARQRIGFAGRRFTAYTFSTASAEGARDLAGEAPLETCFLGLLRNSGLNRLPELVSVLRGDMSFVGPVAIEASQSGPYRPDYLAAKPGLVGICDTSRAVRLAVRRRAAMDRYYARRWSIWLDLAALARKLRDAS